MSTFALIEYCVCFGSCFSKNQAYFFWFLITTQKLLRKVTYSGTSVNEYSNVQLYMYFVELFDS